MILFSKKSFVYLACATGFHTFCSYGLGNWIPSFLFRLHEMTSIEIGTSLGLIIGIGGGIGTFAGGYLADSFGKNDKKWYFKISAYAIMIAMPFTFGVYFLESTTLVLASLAVVYVCYGMFLGPSIAITHALVPIELRAFSSAILFFVLNLVGLGFGPLVVGMLSDLLSPSIGAESIRWALASTVFISLLAIVLFFKAAKYIEDDLKQ